MNKQEAKKRAKELTMGCWWPSTAFPKPRPNWAGIKNELRSLAYQAHYYGRLAEVSEYDAVRELLPS